jgi:hypothetical protein
MEPVVPHPDQDAEARQKLAALEQRTGKRPNILILLLDDIGWADFRFNGLQRYQAVLEKFPPSTQLALPGQ